MPAEIMKLGETDDDSFYERLMDWQTEYQDKWNGKADKALQELMK